MSEEFCSDEPPVWQFDRYQYFKQMVDRLSNEGLLEASRQRPISQATLDFLLARRKDPVSMVNIYCSASREPKFDFFVFQLGTKGASKFLYVTELHGRPVYGICASSKKEAKRACALRLLDDLMAEQRLECVNVSGRKVRQPPPKPLQILPTESPSVEQQKAHNQQGHSNMTFSDDIDLDTIRKNFEDLNPLPTDCKEKEPFAQLRSTAFKLHIENGFWGQFCPSEETKAKMEQCRMANNPIAFVRRCVVLQAMRQPTDAMEENSELLRRAQAKLSFHIFTLPYVPHHYACLALFDCELYHGAISVSKQKAKISCAEVLCEVLAKKGWADVKRAAKKRKNTDRGKALKEKKRKNENGQMERTEEGTVRPSYQFPLTLHPNESLDPKTHFLLASTAKNPIQLLKEVADLEKFEITYSEEVDEINGKYIVHVNTIEGTASGCPEGSNLEAKCSAARKAVDALVRSGRIVVQLEEFMHFRAEIARCLKLETTEMIDDLSF